MDVTFSNPMPAFGITAPVSLLLSCAVSVNDCPCGAYVGPVNVSVVFTCMLCTVTVIWLLVEGKY